MECFTKHESGAPTIYLGKHSGYRKLMPRWTRRSLPAYTYVPGTVPHPVRDPKGHSYGAPEPHVDTFSAERWFECEAFLFGIDLFNAGFYWESHEQWEAVWHCLGRSGTIADFMKGLIKFSAAGVKQLEGRPQGVLRHANRAEALFSDVRKSHAELCGLQLDELINHSKAIRESNHMPVLQPVIAQG